MLSFLGSGIGAIIGVLILYQILKSSIPSYLEEKGKNLATKEDIKDITAEVESVRTEYAKILEELRSSNQIKFAAIDREKNIKKEVYLMAVEAITRSLNAIMDRANLDIDTEKLNSKFANDAGVIAKIQIVGSENTVKAVTNFMAAIGTASSELMLERADLVRRKKSIEDLETQSNKTTQEIERYIEMMKNLNLEGNTDPRLWKVLNENIEEQQKQKGEILDSISQTWDVQMKEYLEFSRKCLRYYFEASELLPSVVLSIRQELDLEISNEAYLDIYTANLKKGQEHSEVFLKKIEKLTINQ